MLVRDRPGTGAHGPTSLPAQTEPTHRASVPGLVSSNGKVAGTQGKLIAGEASVVFAIYED
jgi:hypothetical protein